MEKLSAIVELPCENERRIITFNTKASFVSLVLDAKGHSVVLSDTPSKYDTIRYDTIQCNTIQYNTIQSNTIQ